MLHFFCKVFRADARRNLDFEVVVQARTAVTSGAALSYGDHLKVGAMTTIGELVQPFDQLADSGFSHFLAEVFRKSTGLERKRDSDSVKFTLAEVLKNRSMLLRDPAQRG
ncbi:hypothetical protein HMPREF3113_11310 [Stenotrophomonas sp. HMSC10F06]|nr:hypothetical protein HMPREF3113_11310 [Stenotrophomonas sp. HMSC10F06]